MQFSTGHQSHERTPITDVFSLRNGCKKLSTAPCVFTHAPLCIHPRTPVYSPTHLLETPIFNHSLIRVHAQGSRLDNCPALRFAGREGLDPPSATSSALNPQRVQCPSPLGSPSRPLTAYPSLPSVAQATKSAQAWHTARHQHRIKPYPVRITSYENSSKA